MICDGPEFPPRAELQFQLRSAIALPSKCQHAYLYAPIGAWQRKKVPAGIKGEWMLSMNYTW